MRLTTGQITTIQDGTKLKAVPEDHPCVPKLEDAFGPHTFFVSRNGLLKFERDSTAGANSGTARLFVVAVWEEDLSTGLLRQSPPAATDVVVDMETGHMIVRA